MADKETKSVASRPKNEAQKAKGVGIVELIQAKDDATSCWARLRVDHLVAEWNKLCKQYGIRETSCSGISRRMRRICQENSLRFYKDDLYGYWEMRRLDFVFLFLDATENRCYRRKENIEFFGRLAQRFGMYEEFELAASSTDFGMACGLIDVMVNVHTLAHCKTFADSKKVLDASVQSVNRMGHSFMVLQDRLKRKVRGMEKLKLSHYRFLQRIA